MEVLADALAPALFDLAGALFGFLAPLDFRRGTLLFSERRADLPANHARRTQLALLAVKALWNGPVGSQLAAVAVDAGVDTAARCLGVGKPGDTEHHRCQYPALDPVQIAQTTYLSSTP